MQTKEFIHFKENQQRKRSRNQSQILTILTQKYQKVAKCSNNVIKCFFEEQLTDLTEVQINYRDIIPEQLSCTHYEGIQNLKQLKILKLQHLSSLDWIQETLKSTKYSFSQQFMNYFINLTSIQELTMNNMEIESVESLKDMTQLIKLTLSSNQISDIQYLRNLTNLIELDLSYNSITDIQVIKNMKKLNILYLQANNISNIQYIRKLINLQQLNIGANKISDINALQLLNNMEKLFICENKIVDISPLSGMHKLQKLELDNNYIVDIQPISKIFKQIFRQYAQIQQDDFFKDIYFNIAENYVIYSDGEFLFDLSDEQNQNKSGIQYLIQIYLDDQKTCTCKTHIQFMLMYKMIKAINSSHSQLAHIQQRFKRQEINKQNKFVPYFKLNQLNKEFSKNVQNLFKQYSEIELQVYQ
ncbi:Conserved_hypothetical protein [Hexamita inflata]|uniref:Leucine rich repeat protein n=1 Tax=Hexamita inflata TaxID=28002 RepID=A0AA86R5H8_9EUKA|nr:Conserved hypothetical protein [Hexamita inflata]